MSSFSLAQNINKKSGWVVALGILQIIFGALALSFVGLVSMVSVIYLGVAFMVCGISEFIYGIKNRAHGDMWFHLLWGSLATVCGYIIVNNPAENLVVLTVLIAVLFLAGGIVELVGSVTERFANWGWFALNGMVGIFAGYVILRNPVINSLWLIGTLVGIQMLFRGFAWLSLGMTGRRVAKKVAA